MTKSTKEYVKPFIDDLKELLKEAKLKMKVGKFNYLETLIQTPTGIGLTYEQKAELYLNFKPINAKCRCYGLGDKCKVHGYQARTNYALRERGTFSTSKQYLN
jgi:hypothetical protein